MVIVFVALLVYSFSTSPRPLASPADATKIVLDDLSNDPSLSSREHLFDVFSAIRDDSGNWQVVVKVTLEPHSSCPTAFIRTYQLLPIRHGVDHSITAGCHAGSPIAFPEEAIIFAKDLPQVRNLQPIDHACAYELPLNKEKALFYCPDADLRAIAGFASSLPPQAKWVTEWRSGNSTLYVGLDEQGNALSTS